MSKIFKKIVGAAAPFAGLIPGVGLPLAIGLGAAGGAISGGGLKGALGGAIGAAGMGGGGSILGKALSIGKTGGGALLGAAGGGLSGGAKGALFGAAAGGLAPNLGDIGNFVSDKASGALDSFGRSTGLTSTLSNVAGGLGKAYNSISDGVSDAYNGSMVQDFYKSGTGALKDLGFATSDALGGTSGSGGGISSYGPNQPSSFNFGQDVVRGSADSLLSNAGNIGGDVAKSNYASPIASALMGSFSNNKAEDALMKGQRANQALLSPFANGFEFSPEDLTQDPGYQFNLAQGNQAQDRAQLSRGGFFSGRALKEAQQFGQGLADNTFNSAFTRALQGRQAGLTGALANAGINDNIGNIKANSATNTGNLFSGALGSILGGGSFDNTGALRGGSENDFMTRFLRQQEMERLFGGGASSYGS